MFKVRYGKGNKINSEEVAFISFGYVKEVVEFIKSQIKPHFWHPEEKEWEISKEGLKVLEKQFGGQVTGIKEEDKFWKESVKDYLAEANIPQDFKFKVQPLDYQMRAIKKGLSIDCMLNGSQMGVGKSAESIYVALIRKHLGQINKCLILCGKTILKTNWKKEEIPKFSNETGHILGQRISTRGATKGKAKKTEDIKAKIEDLENIDEIKDFFLITNVESLRNEKFVKELAKLCDNGKIGMVILDEATACKNSESSQGEGLLKINPKYKMPLSGSFVMNSNIDFYAMLKWTGHYKGSLEEFKKHFCVEKIIKKEFKSRWGYNKIYTKEIPTIVGNKNIPELREILKHCMVRDIKKEVQKDLPNVTYKKEYIEMSEEERKLYNIVKGEIKANKEELLLKCNEENATMRLRQVTGNATMVDANIKETTKMNRCIEVAKECVDELNEKVIIFSYFTQITKVLKEKLKDYHPAYVTGEIQSTEIRQSELDRFKNSKDCNILIATIGALGMGVTLVEANNMIFIDEGSYSSTDKSQAMARIDRIGQKSKCLIITLLCEDTIDEKVNQIIETKSQLSDAVLDGGKKVMQIEDNDNIINRLNNKSSLFDYLVEDD